MNRSFKRSVTVALILLSLSIAHHSQTPPGKPDPQTAATATQDISNWQTVSLEGRGIKFKLPPDWHHTDSDFETKSDKFSIIEVEWNRPNDETNQIETIRIVITTIPDGFVSEDGRPASKEQMSRDEFDGLMRRKEDSLLFTETKQLAVSGVAGVFRVLHLNSQDKDIGVREGIIWTGYRFHQNVAQELDITISANPKSDAVLRTIFSTIELEQDKETPRKQE
jgi:hypothetical protein